ncbi:MAG: chemotaxis protein CheW [Sarcina sp.]
MDYCEILIFNLNDKEYAVELEYVERIIASIDIEGVPQSQLFIEGVIDYEDETLTIINLLALFGYEHYSKKEEESRIIVLTDGEEKLGIKVDSVREVTQLSVSEIEKLPKIAAGNDETKVKGLIKAGGVIRILLDAKKILDFQ